MDQDEPAGYSGHLGELRTQADLGLPIPRGVRFRLLKQVIGRAAWLFLHHQVPLNHGVISELEALGEQVHVLTQRVELVARQSFSREHDEFAALRSELSELALQVNEAQEDANRGLANLRRAVTGLEHGERVRQAQVDLFLNQVRRSLPSPPQPEALASLPSPLEGLYPSFEEVFRGPTETIKERVRAYLEDILAIDRRGPVLDIGSGRGEWLEVLREAGVDAYGLDLNEDFVNRSRQRGLDVRLEDARAHLASVPEGSLAAVTAFHLVEHLPVGELIELIDLTIRGLQPGGLVIFETPNPDNLVVGASTFYLDPTHRRPVPSEFLAFLVESRGLADAEVRHARPDDELPRPRGDQPWAEDLVPLYEAVNARLFGAQDYAVVARRL
ncbi:MAG TPA: class I SAM-dependent methyltransferase [Acidimicrobiales bacterium]|nr:class I SAM-dependent methyltransferase [Acidimicrobiales bacterium]